MSEEMWDTFDALSKTLQGQSRLIESLTARVAELERRLDEPQTAGPRPLLHIVEPQEADGLPV